MPFLDGVYHSQVPENPFLNKFSLTELDELIPGIKARVLMLINANSHSDFAQSQSEIIADMRKEGMAPKDIFISTEESVDIPGLGHELDLPTFMMGTGLSISANPAIGIDQSDQGKLSIRTRYKKGSGAPASRKTGFLWDK